MVSRYPTIGDKEQNQIQVLFDLSQAKRAIGDLMERIESLQSMKKIGDKDAKEMLKQLASMQNVIGKIGKKKK